MFNIQETITKTTWAEVKERANAGKIESGERFTFSMKSGERVTVKATRDTKTGKLFFVTEDCLEDERPMNKKDTNKGGWAASNMRKYLNKTIFALLPDDLQEIIVPTTIVQIVDGMRVECEDKLFLLSQTQVFGDGQMSEFEPEDAQLDIFLREKDRVKECGDRGTSLWWLRSPHVPSPSDFCGVGYFGGGNGGNGASIAYGVAFGFSLCEDAKGQS